MPSIGRHVVVTNLLAGRRMLVEFELNDAAEGVTAYQIWRSAQESEGFELMATVNAPYKQYVDTVPFTFGINYFYKVVAVNASGYSSDISASSAVSDSTFDSFEEKPFRSVAVTYDSFIVGETPTGAVNGLNLAYVTANLYRYNTVEVFVNGLALTRGVNFSENANQKTLTLSVAPTTGSRVRVNYIKV